MNYQVKKAEKIQIPETLTYIDVVKGTNYLPDSFTPSYLIKKAIYKKGEEPFLNISPPELDRVDDIELFLLGNMMHINFKSNSFELLEVNNYLNYSTLYGNIEYVVEITYENNDVSIFTSSNPSFSFELSDIGNYKIKAYTRYAKVHSFTSNVIEKYYQNPIYF